MHTQHGNMLYLGESGGMPPRKVLKQQCNEIEILRVFQGLTFKKIHKAINVRANYCSYTAMFVTRMLLYY